MSVTVAVGPLALPCYSYIFDDEYNARIYGGGGGGYMLTYMGEGEGRGI